MGHSIKPVNQAILSEPDLCRVVTGLGEARIAELKRYANERGVGLLAVLVEREGLDEVELTQALAEQIGLPFVCDGVEPVSEAIAAVSPQLAVNYRLMPIAFAEGTLQIAFPDPFDWPRWDEFAQVLGRPVQRVLCPGKIVDQLLKAHYGLGADTVDHLTATGSSGDGDSGGAVLSVASDGGTDLTGEDAANEPTVVNFVNKIITEAISSDATDIHFEPYDAKYRVRYRIDGVLENVPIPASVRQLKLAIVSRIKIMAHLDITEKRLPQDGRAKVTFAGFDYDLRISVLPGVFGEAVNVRIQRRHMVKLDLETLGFLTEQREQIDRLVTRPHGLILVTGPTGSGKTTTLYTCLQKINNDETKIITVEDPVEYWMEDVLQMQVHDEIGFSFAGALRGVLRHDPDVLLVGEIRDRETADIAIRASLTGHLVFATLHTNDAPSAVIRLLDIGIEPFLAASSIHGILAQRLVRNICPHCKVRQDPETYEPYERALLEREGLFDHPMYYGKGCEKCRFTGYRGRAAVGEILLVNQAVRAAIQERQPAEVIRAQALKDGMQTLQFGVLQAARQGKTTVSETLRVTQEEGER